METARSPERLWAAIVFRRLSWIKLPNLSVVAAGDLCNPGLGRDCGFIHVRTQAVFAPSYRLCKGLPQREPRAILFFRGSPMPGGWLCGKGVRTGEAGAPTWRYPVGISVSAHRKGSGFPLRRERRGVGTAGSVCRRIEGGQASAATTAWGWARREVCAFG